MNHGSLFSGIGGFDLAAQWMGWNNVFQVEWDEWCRKVLAKNFPNVLRFGDIVEFNKMLKDGKITTDTRLQRQKVNEKQTEGVVKYNKRKYSIPRIDILTGGFPCQPFSHAGKRKGTDDSRYLWPEMLTTIRTLKPSFVVGENVAGLVSMEDGKTLERIFADLENEGYTVESFIIPACGVGAWHRRDRIWIVAYRNCIRFKGDEHQIRSGKDRENGYGDISLCEKQRRDDIRGKSKGGIKDVPDTISQRRCSGKIRGEDAENVREQSRNTQHGYWNSEPDVGRVADGIPNRVDRLKGLGNAIVPQVAFEIFKAIEKI